VKITAWNTTLEGACHRMDRALREFRIRGVKTNIPFLENVIGHSRFRGGLVTTSFLDESPELFQLPRRGDRATKLLRYIGNVILNGDPQVKGRKAPELFPAPPVPKEDRTPSPRGTRQLLQKLGPRGFADWARKEQRLLLTDTTFRDAHQSLLATRVRTHDLLPMAPIIARRLSDLFSLEMWGGATFDASMRFLHEDPWQRLRELRRLIPNICFQMLTRGANAVGYTSYPPNVIRDFLREAYVQGIDIFRVFDAFNSIDSMRVSIDCLLEIGAVCEGTICYTGDVLDAARPKYNLQYYVGLAKQLEKLGVHFLAIKDMAGVCKPPAAFALVRALREEIGIPVHFHTHDTSGISSASVLEAANAGVDAADGAIAAMSGTTSQPNLNSIVEALRHTSRDTGVDVSALNDCSDYWEIVRGYYLPFDTGPRAGSAGVYQHEIPGGQYTNLREQAAAMGLGQSWHEVERTYAEVNQLFGDIIKVTPSSKVVGDMALFLVTRGMHAKDILKLDEHHDLALPTSVVEMFSGALGTPQGGWPPDVQRIVLRGAAPQQDLFGANMAPLDMAAARKDLEQQLDRRVRPDELLSYLLYPEVFLKFDKIRQEFADVSVLPTPVFFYGLKPDQEVTVSIEAGKTLVIRFLATGQPRPNGTRTLFFELNGQPREVNVRDHSLRVVARTHPRADPADPGQVGAPTAGMITRVSVELNQVVGRQTKLITLDAMKMQTNIYAPIAGRVSKIHVAMGDAVEAKDLLITITP
jgi:pyruvate carboxylase